MKPLRLLTAALCLTATPLFAPALAAQEKPAAIVVLDGSGSMWGQIDGVAKITIAQKVMGELMSTLPADLDLGLTVYGHRRKGDCSDIETLVLPGSNTRAAITSAVNGIKPKGKTPMADAVVAAAKALRHTEEAATVILVSDGIETCVPDVCAVARKLEETGVDFTAHVVGFDVEDPETLAQFQCMADSTGGQFLSAGNATQLAAAVTEVAVAAPTPAPAPAPEPAPLPGSIMYSVTETFGGTSRRVDVEWSLKGIDGQQLIASFHSDFGEQELAEGIYTISVTRVSDGARQEKQVVVRPNVRNVVEFTFEAALPEASLVAPVTGVAGATISVDWTGPNAANDYVDTAPLGAGSGTYLTYSYTNKGTPMALRLPAQPGEYELRYILAEGSQVLARQPITVTEAQFSLEAPASASAGATIDVTWAGNGYDEDYLTVTEIGADAGSYSAYTYVRNGNPAPLRMPTEPGRYEIRYVTAQDTSVSVSREIEITPVAFSVSAVDSTPLGATITVDWTGNGFEEDYLTIAETGSDGGSYLGYVYVREGNPASFRVPVVPGNFELRYVNGQDSTVAASQPITLTDVAVTLTAPSSAASGSTISVSHDGPTYAGDYVTFTAPGAAAGEYLSYTYTNQGNPLQIIVPETPGNYELRYVTVWGPSRVLGAQPFTVE